MPTPLSRTRISTGAEFIVSVEKFLIKFGFTIVKTTRSSAAARLKIGDPSLMAKDQALLCEAVEKMPNNLGYSDAFSFICAAVGAHGVEWDGTYYDTTESEQIDELFDNAPSEDIVVPDDLDKRFWRALFAFAGRWENPKLPKGTSFLEIPEELLAGITSIDLSAQDDWLAWKLYSINESGVSLGVQYVYSRARAATAGLPEDQQFHGYQEETFDGGHIDGHYAELKVHPDLKRMNTKHFVAHESGKTFVFHWEHDATMGRDRLVRQRQGDFFGLYAHRTIMVPDKDRGERAMPLAPLWWSWKHRHTYLGGIIFDPGREAPGDAYNLWKGWSVEAHQPDAQHSCELYKRHIKEVICSGDPAIYGYIWRWMARFVQQPHLPGHCIVVLRSETRTGKTLFAKVLRRLAGTHGIALAHANHLTGNFNSHLRNAVFVEAEEAAFAGDPKARRVLKSLGLDEVLAIEPKGIDIFMQPNRLHIVMCSNDEHVVTPDPDETERFLVLNVSAHRKGDLSYFKAIEDQMDRGGLAALLWELQHVDLTNFDVRVIPTTQAMVEQKILSLDDVASWWFEVLRWGVHPTMNFDDEKEPSSEGWEDGAFMSINGLHSSYRDWVKQFKHVYQVKARNQFGITFRKLHKGTGLRTFRKRHGEDQIRGYLMPSLDECRKAMERHIGGDATMWSEHGEAGHPTKPPITPAPIKLAAAEGKLKIDPASFYVPVRRK